jgi:hypothetical protein
LKQRIKTLEAELANCKCRKQPQREGSSTSQDLDLHNALFTSSSYPANDWDDAEASTDEETHIEQLLVPTRHLIVSIDKARRPHILTQLISWMIIKMTFICTVHVPFFAWRQLLQVALLDFLKSLRIAVLDMSCR